MTIEPSTRFSSGTEYEIFLYNFCQRCSKGKTREDDGFPEFPENGGCPIWDAMEYQPFSCSICQNPNTFMGESAFCPHCGARMDGTE